MTKPSIRFMYAGIRVRSLARSLRFYRGLGFRVDRRGRMEHGGQWVHLVLPPGPQMLELNYYPKGNRFAEPFRKGTELDHLGFGVEDVDLWVRKARRLGARLMVDFSETHERIAYVRDPDGVWVEFCGPPKKKAPPA